MNEKKARVIIPINLDKSPEDHEIEAAWIIARHYNRAVDFLRPVDDYKRKTPDIVMNGQLWEIKSPIGKSKNTIERQIKRAVKQSRNIIVDGRRSAIPDNVLQSELLKQCMIRRSIKQLIFITKKLSVVEIISK